MIQPEGDPAHMPLSARIEASPNRPSSQLIFSLAVPVLAQNFLGMFVGISDTLLAGRILGTDVYLAAAIVASYLLWLLECLGSLIYSGSNPIVARLLGAGKREEANEIAWQAVLLACALGAFLTAATWLLAAPMSKLMNLEGAARDAATLFLRIVAFSVVPMTILMVGTGLLRAAGHTVPAMWILLLVNVVNIAVSWALTVGIGPLPTMGFAGIATGTACAFGVGGLATIVLLWRGYREIRLPRTSWRLDPVIVARILRIGIPGAASSLLIVVCQLWFLAIIGKLGTEATAAHGVAIRCESLSWLCGDAFAIAAATLVGQSLGLLRPDLARRYAWRSFAIATAILTAWGFALFFGADGMARIFASSEVPVVREQAASVLRLIAFGMPALAASIVITGSLQGAGDTRGPFLYNTIGMLLFRIPLAYALTEWFFGLGLLGAWIAMVLDLYVRGLLSLARFLAGRWMKVEV